MSDFINEDQIDDYINNNLSVDAKLTFETAMLKDEKLKHAVENYYLIKKLSGSLIEDETREMLKNMSALGGEKLKISPSLAEKNEKLEKNESQAQKNKFQISSLVKFAAAACFLFVVSYFSFQLLAKPSLTEQLVELREKPISQGTRSPDNGELTRIDSAIDKFELRRYNEAKALFDPIPTDDSLKFVTKRYLAHINFINEDYNTSASLFTELENHPQYNREAKRNLVLCHLLLKDKSRAKKYYEESLQVNAFKDDEKKVILKALEE